MSSVMLLYAIVLVIQVVFLALSYVFVEGFGGRVLELNMGSIKLFSFRLRGVTVVVGPLPTASVTMLGHGEGERDADRSWFRMSRGTRVLVRVGPWLVMLLVAMACLGPEPALRSFARGFSQLLFVVDLTPLTRELLAIIEHAPLYIPFGIVLTKMVAMSFLPIAGAAGGAAIDELRGKPAPAAWMAISMLGALVWIGGRVVWAIAHAL